MEEVRELKEVLEKVEAKILAAGKMYGAMNFVVWMNVMLLFYVLMGIFELPGWGIALYWMAGFGGAFWFTGKIWQRLAALMRASGKKGEVSTFGSILIFVSWILGATLGWILIPSTSIAVSEGARMAVGFLSFMTISIFGMWLVFARYGGIEREMVPAFLIPALGIPFAWGMSTGAMIWAGFVVALGFAVTIMWYLYSAFKAIG
ncbi:MAG: hypothetical protein J7K57_03450 [Palaeococcus sp.]|uniref:hypothetical protein n=1 Tax=Palaeococcus sp. (in: euryarchaeotes) TaxID=2820298 RepID=UPI0025F6DE64|nr:hypothetical protein [Palaeococcus sp. (in: euryarchaeotes)]MCD6558914.1 hypothetical protein [Palaeococcus sp. (in: euryarchaeotes)]